MQLYIQIKPIVRIELIANNKLINELIANK